MTGRLTLLLCLAMLAAPSVALASGGGDAMMMDFVYRIMNFAVLVGVLFFVLKKPLKNGLAGRAQSIKDELEELEAKREQAEREYALMEKRLNDAETERESILEEYRKQGAREKARIIEDAHILSERIKSQAQFTIEQETKQAKAELRREIADLSAALAEDLVKENITADDQKHLVKDYLAKVGQEVQ